MCSVQSPGGTEVLGVCRELVTMFSLEKTVQRGSCEQGGGRVDWASSQRVSVYILVSAASTEDRSWEGTTGALRNW